MWLFGGGVCKGIGQTLWECVPYRYRFETYNQSGIASTDLQAHRWSFAKLLFDYTPYDTMSAWTHWLADARWVWPNHERKCAGLNQPVSRINWNADRNDIWTRFELEEWSRFRRLAEALDVANWN